MSASRRRKVAQRAQYCCEYCQLPEHQTSLPHELDHIRAQKHHGATSFDNLCWACASCNAAKGPNVAGFDPETDELVPLFNPRQDRWSDHFRWDGPRLCAKTPVGRATIDVLRINDAQRIEHRRLWGAIGKVEKR